MNTPSPAQKTSRKATSEESVYVSPAHVSCDQTRPKCRARTRILLARRGVPLATRNEVLNRRNGPLLKICEWKTTKYSRHADDVKRKSGRRNAHWTDYPVNGTFADGGHVPVVTCTETRDATGTVDATYSQELYKRDRQTVTVEPSRYL